MNHQKNPQQLARLGLAVLLLVGCAASPATSIPIVANPAPVSTTPATKQPEYFDQGVSAYEEGDFNQAIADFTSAIELDPKKAEAYNYRGHAYSGKSSFDRAISDFTSAIGISPNYFDAYANRALTYDNMGGPMKRSLTTLRRLSSIQHCEGLH
jgi:tetratricopeptide (TPR) repeat protein